MGLNWWLATSTLKLKEPAKEAENGIEETLTYTMICGVSSEKIPEMLDMPSISGICKVVPG